MTKLTKIQFSNIEELQAENLRKMLLAAGQRAGIVERVTPARAVGLSGRSVSTAHQPSSCARLAAIAMNSAMSWPSASTDDHHALTTSDVDVRVARWRVRWPWYVSTIGATKLV